MGFLIALIWILNFGISWFNAYSVGRSWADSKAIGGWPRFLVWCAAVMSACGFTWCYLIVVAFGASAFGYLDTYHLKMVLELGYVVIIVPILGAGLGIWIDSLTTAWRRRDLASIGVAGWNTFAQVHNTYQAASALPGIFEDLGSFFSDSDSDNAQGKVVMLVVALVVLALLGGIFTTVAIVRTTARKYAQSVTSEAQSLLR